MNTLRQLNNGNIENAKKTHLITYKCVILACVLHYFFHADTGIVFKIWAQTSPVFLLKRITLFFYKNQ